MKKPAILFFLTLLIVTISSGEILSQRTDRAISKPHNPISPSLIELSNIRQEIDKNVRGFYNDHYGHIQSAYGRLSFPSTLNKLDIIRQFFNSYNRLLNVSDFSSNFKLLRENKNVADGKLSSYIFRQFYNNLPVYGSYLSATLENKSGVLLSYDTTHRSDLPQSFNLNPRLNQNQALTVAKRDLPGYDGWQALEIMMVKDDDANKWHLAWQLRVGDLWEYLIDAHTGAIIMKRSLVRHLECSPENVEWKSGIDTSHNDDLPVCNDYTKYYLYTGSNIKPPIELHDIKGDDTLFTEDRPHHYVNLEKKYPIESFDSWPPSTTENVEMYSFVYKAISFLKDTLNYEIQYGYSTSNEPWTVILYTNVYPNYGGALTAGNRIITPGYVDDRTFFSLSHELMHIPFIIINPPGMISSALSQGPDTTLSIEEGLASAIGGIIEHHYSGKWKYSPVWNDEMLNYTYEDFITAAEESMGNEDEKGVSEWPYIMGSIIEAFRDILISGKPSLNTDHLLTPEKVGWLLIETIQYKTLWTSNMTAFANAVLATCMERAEVGVMFTENECKYVETVIASLEIPLYVGYNPNAFDFLHPKPIYVDWKINFPVSEHIKSGFGANEIDIQPNMLGSIEMEGGKIDWEKLKYIEFDWKDNLLESKLKINVYDDTAGKLFKSIDSIISHKKENSTNFGIWFNLFDPMEIFGKITPHEWYEELYSYSLIDIPRTFTIELTLQGQDDSVGYVETDQSNNILNFSFGPNFAPVVHITLANEKPMGGKSVICSDSNSSSKYKKIDMFGFLKKWFRLKKSASKKPPYDECLYEWNVKISAINNGNKPTYPVVDATYQINSFSDESMKKFKKITNKHYEKISGNWLSDLNKWWFSNDEFFDGKCIPHRTEMEYVLPGESFCVKEFTVTAGPKDLLNVTLDPADHIPELDEIDNYASMTFVPVQTSPPCPGTTPIEILTCMDYRNKIAMEMMAGQLEKGEFTEMTSGTMSPIGPRPSPYKFMFRHGEKIVMPPDKNGIYSNQSFVEPYSWNKNTFESLARNH